MNIFRKLRQILTGIQNVIPENTLLIDVRLPSEFAAGHLENAINISIEQLTDDIVKVAPQREQPLAVYCASGMRSAAARAVLIKMGYTMVINAGGLGAAAQVLGKKII